MIEEKLETAIKKALKSLSVEVDGIHLEFPTELSHGDYSTNVAMVAAKKARKNPRELAQDIAEQILKNKPDEVERIEVAGPGFINFFLTRDFFTNSLQNINEQSVDFGKSQSRAGEKLIIEYMNVNPFKQFHIGHLMPTTIGESLARLMEYTGAEVKRASYQGDVGMHIAKGVWGMTQDSGNFPAESDSVELKVEFLSNAYSFGARAFEESEEVRHVITRINKEIYEKNNEEINNLYETGRRWSLEGFEIIYDLLGTGPDLYFFESEVAEKGRKMVLEGLKDGVFEKSKGAIVYKGEKHGLYTSVFVNSEGLPTYDGKELALAKEKYERYPYDISIVVAGSEINDYFKVLLAAMREISPELAKKTQYIGHGMLRLPEGKVSSRKGGVTPGEHLVNMAIEQSVQKMASEYSEEERKEIARDVGVAAIKYWILRQATSRDVIFEIDKALSFEGDSGPYLQYSTVRARSVIDKARAVGISPATENAPEATYVLEKLLGRFPKIVSRAQREKSPHYVSTYLLEIAGEFNSFYAQEKIADSSDSYSAYKLSLTESFATTMESGLYLLGIKVPKKM